MTAWLGVVWVALAFTLALIGWRIWFEYTRARRRQQQFQARLARSAEDICWALFRRLDFVRAVQIDARRILDADTLLMHQLATRGFTSPALSMDETSSLAEVLGEFDREQVGYSMRVPPRLVVVEETGPGMDGAA